MSKIHLFLNEIKLESCGEVRISVVLCVWCQCHWRRLNKNSLMMLALPAFINLNMWNSLCCYTVWNGNLCFSHYSYKNSLNLGNYSTLMSSATGDIYGIWWYMSTSSGPNKYPLCKTCNCNCKNKWKYQKLTYTRSKKNWEMAVLFKPLKVLFIFYWLILMIIVYYKLIYFTKWCKICNFIFSTSS